MKTNRHSTYRRAYYQRTAAEGLPEWSSANANYAKERGEKTATEWQKILGLDKTKTLFFLNFRAWHHTGTHARRTNFYTCKINDCMNEREFHALVTLIKDVPRTKKKFYNYLLENLPRQFKYTIFI